MLGLETRSVMSLALTAEKASDGDAQSQTRSLSLHRGVIAGSCVFNRNSPFGVFDMMKRYKSAAQPRVVAVMSVLAILTGCATSAQPTTEDTEAFASRVIADKVAVAVNTQHSYVAALNADRAKAAAQQQTLDTDQVDIDYIGYPQELLQTLAARYGYAYVESGKRVTLKPINVWVRKATPLNVLKDIGVQVDHGADVVLDKNAKTVRLIYKPVVAGRG